MPARVERPRLLELLDQGLQHRVTLVAAPAGYGKTTLLSQWVQHQQMPIAWLTADEGDDDPAKLMAGLVAAVRTISDRCCAGVGSLIDRSAPPPSDLMVREFVRDLDELDDFVLVLDDCHHLKNPAVLGIIERLISQPPVPLHLVLSGRADPMLPLGSYRGKGLLQEVRAVDLRFTEEEAAVHLGQVLSRQLGETAVSSLVERTEGWIAGLHLAALSLAGRDDVEEGVRKFAGSDRFIADYLMDELLTRLAPELERYLVVTSILDRLSADLCHAVLGEPALDTYNGRPVLEWLEEENLFVVSLDERREWFRYHHLFRDLLQHRLQVSRSPQEVAELHLRAGRWLGEAHLVDDALSHLLSARSPELAADLVQDHRAELMEKERWRTLERWLSRLEPQLVDSRPGLVLAHAWLAYHKADDALARSHCDRAERLLQGTSVADEASLRGEMAALRSQHGFWQGDGDGAVEEAQEALALFPQSRGLLRGVAVFSTGGGLHHQGHNARALEVLTEGSYGDYGRGAHPRVLVALGLLLFANGEIEQAASVGRQLLARADELGLEESRGWGHLFLGLAAYLRNDLESAERSVQSVDPHASNFRAVRQSFYILAWTRLAQGRQDEALDAIRQFRSLAANLRIPLGQDVTLLEARIAGSGRCRIDGTALARRFVLDGRERPLVLNFCFELSELSAIAILLREGEKEDLTTCLQVCDRLLAKAEAQGNVFRCLQCLVLRAMIFDTQARSAESVASLGKAVELAKPGGVVRLFPDLGERVHALLQSLRTRGRSEPFLDDVMASFWPQRNGSPSPAMPDSAGSHPLLGSTPSPRPLPDHFLYDAVADYFITNRELDVLELLEQRLSNKEIARQLVISPATVKHHTLSIYRKLGVESRREAAVKARRLGVLSGSR